MGSSRAKIAGAVSLAVVAVSTAALFILLSRPLSALAVAAGRVTVTGLLLVALGWKEVARLRCAARERPEIRWRIALAAALLALHFAAWIGSLSFTSVLRSMALVATQPIFAGLLGRLVGDRVRPSLYLGAAIAMIGTAVLAGPAVLDGVDGNTFYGDALAVVGAAAAAGYLVVGRSVRDHVEVRAYLGSVHLGAALILAAVIAVATGLGADVLPDELPPTGALLAVLALGVIPGVVGHGLLNWAVRHAPVHLVSLVILVEPLGATALVAIFVGTTITTLDVVGAAILTLGVAVGLRGERASNASD